MGLFTKPLRQDRAERQMFMCFRPEREHSKSLALLIEHLSTQRTRLERRVDRVVSSE